MNTTSQRRRHGLFADAQRAVTGWLFRTFHLRRASDAGARRRIILIMNLAFTAFALPKAGWGSSGTEGASFLNIPVGARPAALGSGYTALATDAYAPTWNPAGLGFAEANELAGQHLSYLESIHYEYLSLVHPLARRSPGGTSLGSGIGSSIQYLGSGDIPGRDINGKAIPDFSSHYAAYTLAYGRMVTDKLSLGVSGKWIHAKIAEVSASAFAGDIAALYRVNNRLQLASTFTNLGSKLKFLQQADSLPMAWHLAAAFLLAPRLRLNGEFEYRKNGQKAVHAGAEWSPIEAIALRVGYRTDTLKGLSPLAGLTTGIGLRLKGQEFSYAWLPYGELGNTQYFSAVLRFGGPVASKRDLIHYKSIETPQNAYAAPDEEADTARMMTRRVEAPRLGQAAPSEQMLNELLASPEKNPLAKQ